MEIMDKSFIANRIKQLREAKGDSKYQMSYNLGRSRSYIHNIETQHAMPLIKDLLEIIHYLGVTPRQFFDTNHSLVYLEALKELDKCSNDDLKLIIEILNRLNANK